MADIDRNASFLLLRRCVNRIEGSELRPALLRQMFRNGSGQGRLTVINVTDGSNIEMRPRPFKLFLSHFNTTPSGLNDSSFLK